TIATGLTRGVLTLTGCTLSGNSASSYGAAIYTIFSTVTLSDCTISGNSAVGTAGLALLGSINSLTACTIAANTTTSRGPGGLLANGGTTTLLDMIIAGNKTPTIAGDFFATGNVSGLSNLIGVTSVSSLDPHSNILGVTDAKLGPLASNGGPT